MMPGLIVMFWIVVFGVTVWWIYHSNTRSTKHHKKQTPGSTLQTPQANTSGRIFLRRNSRNIFAIAVIAIIGSTTAWYFWSKVKTTFSSLFQASNLPATVLFLAVLLLLAGWLLPKSKKGDKK